MKSVHKITAPLRTFIITLLVLHVLTIYFEVRQLQEDVKKLTEEKTITCKLGKELPGVNNTVWICVGNDS